MTRSYVRVPRRTSGKALGLVATMESRSSAPVVGREQELERLRAFLSDRPAGLSALALEGAPGSGKTTLWRTGLELAREGGTCVLAAAPSETEAEIPYAVLSDLLEPLTDEVEALPPPQAAALGIALARTEGAPPPPLAIRLGVQTLLEKVAARQPLLLAVDDLHCVDPSSARALEFALKRATDAPLWALFARRTGEDSVPLPVPADRAEVLPVPPLGLEPFARMLRTAAGRRLSRPELVRLHRAAGGNPLFGLELARLEDEATAPGTVTAALGMRLATISDQELETILAAALLAGPTVATLERAFPERRVIAELEAAARAGILELGSDGAIRFAHPLWPEAIKRRHTPATLRTHHASLAAHVSDPVDRAQHLQAATTAPDKAVADELAATATLAEARGGLEEAALLAERAARLSPSAREATQLLVRAAELHVDAGSPVVGRELLTGRLDEVEPGEERGEILLGLARAWDGEDLPRARSFGLQALEENELPPELEARVQGFLSDVALGLADGTSYADHARAAVACAERAGHATELATALLQLCMVELLCGRGVRSDLLARARTHAAEGSPGRFEDRIELFEGGLLKRTDEFARGRAILAAGLAEAVATGNESARYSRLLDLADLEMRAGRPGETLVLTEEAAELGAQIGVDGYGAGALRWHAAALLEVGETERARTELDEADALAGAAGILVYQLAGRRVRGLIELAESRPEAALPLLREAHERLRDAGLHDPSWNTAPPLLDALLGTGRYDEAERLAHELARSGRELDRPLAVAIALRFEALAASGSGDNAAAVRLLDEALDHHARVDQQLERARTLAAVGAVQRRLRRKGLARTALTEAAAAFRSCGSTARAAQAENELARLGLRPGHGGELTPMERKVGEVLAGGATTRDAAAALFLSPKTVEFHLRNVYRKLGIRSRAELAHRLPPVSIER